MLCMWLFNLVLASYIAILLLGPLFGVTDYETFMQGLPKTPNEVNAFLFVQGTWFIVRLFNYRHHVCQIGVGQCPEEVAD